jgi:hypothetical protein
VRERYILQLDVPLHVIECDIVPSAHEFGLFSLSGG